MTTPGIGSSSTAATAETGRIGDSEGRTQKRLDQAGRGRRSLGRAASVIKPLVVLLVLCVIWQIAVDRHWVQEFLLASPTQIIGYIVHHPGEMWTNAWATIVEVLIGFSAALVIGLILAVVMCEFRIVEDSLLPLFVTFQVIPTVAIAPLLVLFLGFGLEGKVVTALIVCIFPLIVNTVAGLRSLDEDTVSLALSLRANKFKMMTYFRLPNALPFIFAGARTSISLAVIGAVIGEFVSADKGLGYLVQQASSVLNTKQLYASLVCLALVGIILFTAVRVIEWWAMPWRRKRH
jgi:NitT/TauT family transport system permease protein